MPTGGRREPVTLSIASGRNRYGEPDTTTTVSTWAELLDAEAGVRASAHESEATVHYRLRIAYLSALPEGAFDAGDITATVRERDWTVRAIRDVDGRRRWQELELI